jgi:predicted ester cyclase
MNSGNQAPPESLQFSPEVAALLAGTSLQARLGQSFVRFAHALRSNDESLIDQTVTADARFHELEELGLPPGPAGFKIFRREMNAAFPDQCTVIAAMRFEGTDIIEADLDATATHLGDVMGIPASGKTVRFRIHTRNRFVGDRMAERWDRMDVQDLLRQLTGP